MRSAMCYRRDVRVIRQPMMSAVVDTLRTVFAAATQLQSSAESRVAESASYNPVAIQSQTRYYYYNTRAIWVGRKLIFKVATKFLPVSNIFLSLALVLLLLKACFTHLTSVSIALDANSHNYISSYISRSNCCSSVEKVPNNSKLHYNETAANLPGRTNKKK